MNKHQQEMLDIKSNIESMAALAFINHNTQAAYVDLCRYMAELFANGSITIDYNVRLSHRGTINVSFATMHDQYSSFDILLPATSETPKQQKDIPKISNTNPTSVFDDIITLHPIGHDISADSEHLTLTEPTNDKTDVPAYKSVDADQQLQPNENIADKIGKWLANILFVFAMISLLNPHVAAHSVTPWVAFFMVNVIYLRDSIKHKNWPWLALCVFTGLWDILLIISRTATVDVFEVLQPLINLLEILP